MRKFKPSILFRNNKFLIVLSLILSFTIWLAISSSTDIDTTMIISDIPISVELSAEAQKDNLQVFTTGDMTGSVSVTGNSATVRRLSKNDIQIIPQKVNEITTSGEYKLQLVAKKTGLKTGYEIVSDVSPSYITVTVDKFATVDMPISDEDYIYHVDEGYYGATVLSEEKVTLTGAKSEIDKVASVKIVGKIEEVLKSSLTEQKELKLFDKNNKELEPEFVTMSVSDVSTTIYVVPKKTVPIKLSFTNKPPALNLDKSWVTINPSELLIAGSENDIKDINSIELGPIDFSDLKNTKTNMSLDINLPSAVKNLSNEAKVNVILDFSSLSKKTLEITNFTTKGLAAEYTNEISTKSMSVTIFGPKAKISKIAAKDLSAVLDFTNKTDIVVGATEWQLLITPSASYNDCWVYGSYKANVIISEK